MGAIRDFVINFGNLAPGEHEFEFEVKDSFFQRFENSVVQKGNVDVLVVVEKKESMLLLDFTMEGTVTVPCDRCLEDLDLDIEGYNELIVKVGEENAELSEDVIMISSKEHEIDVSQFIYEYITLMIPMRNVHDEEENGQSCDPEILKELEKHLTHESPEPPPDPRWDALKNINLN
jgi:uncharacterized metal-binding protein YceD (DUF177 family)